MKLGQLKRAFWEVFHHSGELRFPIPGIPGTTKGLSVVIWGGKDKESQEKEAADVTESYFRDLLVRLTGDTKWWHVDERPLDDELEL